MDEDEEGSNGSVQSWGLQLSRLLLGVEAGKAVSGPQLILMVNFALIV